MTLRYVSKRAVQVEGETSVLWGPELSPALQRTFFPYCHPMPQFAACKKPKGIVTSVVTIKHSLDYEDIRYYSESCDSLKHRSGPT